MPVHSAIDSMSCTGNGDNTFIGHDGTSEPKQYAEKPEEDNDKNVRYSHKNMNQEDSTPSFEER